MRKRERENPCGVCGHYHRYEEGEVCGICGHRIPASDDKPIQHASAFPSEILKDFLYLGSYDNASRGELLKTLGISRILNTVPTCQNLYKNSFTYHCLPDDKKLLFDDANHFLEQCEKDKARVLVHCMSGKNRSPAIVIAYLMRSRGWQFQQSFQWVKDLRQQVELTPAVHEQLAEFENRLFGSNKAATSSEIPTYDSPFGFNLGFSNTTGTAQTPTFSHSMSTSISQPFGTYTAESMALLNVDERSLHSLPHAGSETPMDIQLHASCWEQNPHGTAQTPTSSQSISTSISQHIGTYAAASSAFVFGAGRTYSTMPRAGSETPKDSL